MINKDCVAEGRDERIAMEIEDCKCQEMEEFLTGCKWMFVEWRTAVRFCVEDDVSDPWKQADNSVLSHSPKLHSADSVFLRDS